MAIPIIEDPTILPPELLATLELFQAQLATFLTKEHHADGTHAAVTADNLTVNTTTAATATAGAGAAVAPEKFLPITVNGISYKLALFLP